MIASSFAPPASAGVEHRDGPGPMSARERAGWEAEAELHRRRLSMLLRWRDSGRLAPAAVALAQEQIDDLERELRFITAGLEAHARVTPALYYRFERMFGQPYTVGLTLTEGKTMATSNAAHTPGPWTVTKRANVETSTGQTIMVPGEDCALARLIASAPEMLEALHRIAYGLETDGRTMDGLTREAAAKLARAAIAKAEGRAE